MFDSTCRGGLGPVREPGGALSRLLTMLDRGAGGRPSKAAQMNDRWSTGRTEAFSDGVFAIAITLLVLDLSIPATEFHDLWAAIAGEWPAYLAYATSFLTIGGIWLTHHGIFARVQYVDRRLMTLNLLLLMAVSFLPFPTRLIAEAIRSVDAERAAATFYGLSLLVISVLMGALWATAARDRDLLKPDVSQEEIETVLRRTTPSIGFYALVILLSLVLPHVAAIGYLVIAIVVLLQAHGDETLEKPAPQT
jgi:TMEM175 potassium channel family protein